MDDLRQLGRYQLQRVLGRGAMGVVYEGIDPKLNRQVAVKLILKNQINDKALEAEYSARFIREAQAVARLNHPNIVTVFDFGEENEIAFLVMELIRGDELKNYFDEKKSFSIEDAVRMISELLDALDYAHQNGIVHRDIKPANIMYEPEGDIVKVADFGIARITDSSKTKTGMVLGTPSYMSPEQLYGQKVDGRSDIFSLTVSMYQMLSGHLPFVGDSMGQLMYKIANEATPDIRAVRPGVPAPLVAIIFKGMEKDIEKRYQTGDDMAADLKALLAGKPISAPPAPALVASAAPAAAATSASGSDSEYQATAKVSAQTPPTAQ